MRLFPFLAFEAKTMQPTGDSSHGEAAKHGVTNSHSSLQHVGFNIPRTELLFGFAVALSRKQLRD